MKNFTTLMIVLACCFTVNSCSDDSDDNPLSNGLTGSYRLTSAILPTAQDFDNDGDTSTNAVVEGPCYNDSWISFHDNGTYDGNLRTSTGSANGFNLNCSSESASGTYTVSGDRITTIDSDSGDSITFTLDADSRTVMMADVNALYPSWNATSSQWSNVVGNVTYTFAKYTDDDQDNGATADDNGENDDENNANFWLLGDFSLTSFTTATAQNLDNDTDNSTNLVSESSCYGQSYITFHQNGTYEEERNLPAISGNSLSLSCHTENTSGTWTRSGDTIATTRTVVGTGSVNTAYNLDANTHLLTRTDANGNYPTFNTGTSLFTMLTGSVNYIYTRS